MVDKKLYCPCGGELKGINTVPSGHTHQCVKCGNLHAPYGLEDGMPDEGMSPTELLFGAEAAPDYEPEENKEFCIWCEHYTADEIDWVYQDTTIGDYDYANYAEYKCTYCGAEFRLGTATVTIADITKDGEKEKHVDYGLNE